MSRVWNGIFVIALMGCSASGPDKVIKSDAIVSTTLCADTYLLALPDLEPRLAALSWQSRSSLSRASDTLKALPQADEDLERLHQWKAATLISSAGTKGDVNLTWGEDFNAVWENFTLLSSALNVTDPSPAFQAQLHNLPKPEQAPRLLYLDRSGATAGTGTFVDAVFRAAGADNIITTAGWHSPDTETLLGLTPDAVVTSFMNSEYVGVNDRSVRHRALAEKIETLPQINIHGGLWPCAGPGLIEATTQLSDALAGL